MITLNGVGGNGALIGTFNLPRHGTHSPAYCDCNDLDYMVPAGCWRCPPPDNRWYDCKLTSYGPLLSSILVGDLVSIPNKLAEWNPCKHSTLSGDAWYRGPSGTMGAWFTKMASSQKSSFTAQNSSTVPRSSAGQFHSVMIGRPCTISDPKCFSNKGIKVSQDLSASGDAQRYWNYDSALGGLTAPDSVRSTLLAAGPIYSPGDWYMRSYNGSLVPAGPGKDRVHWIKTNWYRPDRCTFRRVQIIEYHTNDSYVKDLDPRLVASSGVHQLMEEDLRDTECTVTHIRSDSPGRFYIRYDVTTHLTWRGWQPWDYFSGDTLVTNTAQERCLLILEPGIAPEAPELSLAEAQLYCDLAKPTAKLLYDPKTAMSARTNAVLDVQELDSNWIENLAGAKGTLEVMRPLLDGANAISGGDLAAARKALASAYLVYKYVVAPALADVKDLEKHGIPYLSQATINRFSRERRRGASYTGSTPICGTCADLSYHTTYYLSLKHDVFSQIWGALEKIGLEPSAGQAWDLIPYSFVVDWFSSVGDALKLVDKYNSLVLTHDILARIESFKVQWPLEGQTIDRLFNKLVCSNGRPIEYSWYDRRVYRDAGDVDPLALSTPNGLSASQMAQGTALITQML